MNDRVCEVIIDELVLYGAAVLDRERFRTQVAQELERLLEQEGDSSFRRTVGDSDTILAAPHVSLSTAQVPDPAQLARVIHEAMRR